MGLATPWPAISGAEPPDGSYIPKYKGLHSSRPASPDAPSSALSSAPSSAPSSASSSAVPTGLGFPSEALGSMPSDPEIMAISSERISPKRLPVTMTSNEPGCLMSCMAALST